MKTKIKIFPEIDTTTATETAQGLTPSQQTHRSTIQGTYGSGFSKLSRSLTEQQVLRLLRTMSGVSVELSPRSLLETHLVDGRPSSWARR